MHKLFKLSTFIDVYIDKIDEHEDEEMHETHHEHSEPMPNNKECNSDESNVQKCENTEANNIINSNCNKNEIKDEAKDLRLEIMAELLNNEIKSVKPRRFSMTSLHANSNDNTSLTFNQNNNLNASAIETNTTRSPNLMTNIFILNQQSNPLGSNISNINAASATIVPPAANQYNLEPHLSQYGVETTNINELHGIMQKINTWGIEVFLLDELTMHHPLTAVTYTIFQVILIEYEFKLIIFLTRAFFVLSLQKRDLLKKFMIPPKKLLNYINTIEEHYHDVPYHNRIHAADVTQSVHVLLNSKILEVIYD